MSIAPTYPDRVLSRLRALWRDRSGVSVVEFAFSMPLLLAAGGYGVELSNLALSHLKVSQYALNLADTASRVGVFAGAGVTNLREADINDVLQGTRLQSAAIKLTTHGRVTLSSLERVRQTYDNAANPPAQRIHWQRCIGVKSGGGYDSSFGAAAPVDGRDDTAATKGVAATDGMGDTNPVHAPAGSGVMFVEVNYDYQPLFGSLYVGATKIHYTASFIVRDNRNFAQIFNPTTPRAAPRATCDKHVA